MSFSHSHIEVDFLLWTHFSNYMLLFCMLLLLLIFIMILYKHLKFQLTIYKTRSLLENSEKLNSIISFFNQTDFLRKLVNKTKKIIKLKYKKIENVDLDEFIETLKLKIKQANNYSLASLLLLTILFIVPVIDLIFQYLMCFGTNIDMEYLASTSITMFLLSRHTAIRIILFITSVSLVGSVLVIYKIHIYKIIRYLVSIKPIRINQKTGEQISK